jgi:hypothetical protein
MARSSSHEDLGDTAKRTAPILKRVVIGSHPTALSRVKTGRINTMSILSRRMSESRMIGSSVVFILENAMA